MSMAYVHIYREGWGGRGRGGTERGGGGEEGEGSYTIHIHLHLHIHLHIYIHIHIHKGEREYAPFSRCLERREPPRKNLKLAAARQDRIIISGPDKPLSGCIRAVLLFLSPNLVPPIRSR